MYCRDFCCREDEQIVDDKVEDEQGIDVDNAYRNAPFTAYLFPAGSVNFHLRSQYASKLELIPLLVVFFTLPILCETKSKDNCHPHRGVDRWQKSPGMKIADGKSLSPLMSSDKLYYRGIGWRKSSETQGAF